MPANGIPEIAILQSRTTQDDLIEKFHLEQVYGDRVVEDARKDLQKQTVISENARSGIVTIVVTDRNADRASAMSREYAAEINRIVMAMSRKSAQGDRIYFQQQLARTSAELKAAESRVGSFSSGAMVVDAADQTQAAIRREGWLQQAIDSREADLQSLRAEFTDESPDARVVEAQIAELRKELSEFAGKQDPAEPNQPHGRAHGGAATSLHEIPFVAARYNDLNRLVENKEGIAQDLNKRYQSALLQESSDVPPVAVLDEPSVSPVRVWPLYFGIAFIGICLSVFLASAYTIIIHEVVHETAHETVSQTPDQLDEAALPVTAEAAASASF
jgi:uncharacterized protein involved in exopolysaccharide biosynthesis